LLGQFVDKQDVDGNIFKKTFYDVLEIGEGAFGSVCAAYANYDDHVYAVKKIKSMHADYEFTN
jgi:hypothetical protein